MCICVCVCVCVYKYICAGVHSRGPQYSEGACEVCTYAESLPGAWAGSLKNMSSRRHRLLDWTLSQFLYDFSECWKCVFRLLLTNLQQPGGTIVTAPSGLRSLVCGESLRPSLAANHHWAYPPSD